MPFSYQIQSEKEASCRAGLQNPRQALYRVQRKTADEFMPTPDMPNPLLDFFANSSIALALAAAETDNELLLVNKPFSTLTGYESHDVLGRNCRLLQSTPAGAQANNADAKAKIHAFLQVDGPPTVRTAIVNFRKDGRPFVNLLFMSKLRASSGEIQYIFASQFDVSRAHPNLLKAYDAELGAAVARLRPLLEGHNVMIEGTLATIANSTTTIAQAKLTLSELETDTPY
jgi:PAS domain S-box-containing protein